ncbi:MAG: glycerate kinase [Thermoplasmata archaeon]
MIANAEDLVANRTSPALQALRRDALEILASALRAVDSERLVTSHLRLEGETLEADSLRWDLDEIESLRLLAVGKASLPMARAVLSIVEPKETLIITAVEELPEATSVSVIQASHPVPGEGSLQAGREALAMAERSGPRDLFILLLSGGGSAMLEHSDLPLHALEETTRILLRGGMDTGSMNVVRKHLSLVKGGWLGKAAVRRGGAGLALALSDVVGDAPTDIASGPSVPDPSTFREARQVLEDRDLWDIVPDTVRVKLQAGLDGEVDETPKPGDAEMDRFPLRIVGGIRDACKEAIAEGDRRGYRTHSYGSQVEGETRAVAKDLLATGVSVQETGSPIAAPGLIVVGGETTFQVRGSGLGGRNLELVLATVRGLRDRPIVLLSCDTDGRDGETDVAGAVADGETLGRAHAAGWQPEVFQAESDSYSFFSHLGDVIRTGPTKTNVMDLQLVLIGLPSDEGRGQTPDKLFVGDPP